MLRILMRRHLARQERKGVGSERRASSTVSYDLYVIVEGVIVPRGLAPDNQYRKKVSDGGRVLLLALHC